MSVVHRDHGPAHRAHGPARKARHRRVGLLAATSALLLTDLVVVATGALPYGHGSGPRIHVAEPAPAPLDTTVTSTTVAATTTSRPVPATSTSLGAVTGAGRGVAGQSAPTPTGTAARAGAAPACPAGACVTFDATSPLGPFGHPGAGLNLLPSDDSDGSQVRALGTTMYRSAPSITSLGTYDWRSWDAAVSGGAQTTLILSNLWSEKYNNSPPTPWSNWSAYTNWVRSTVQQILASGQQVNYWDVYNEPGWHNYYSQADFQQETPDDLLQQFLVTYQTIKSVDPLAAIVGPSIGQIKFSPLPPNTLTHEPDINTFLHFAAAHGIQLAAVAWHDNGQWPATISANAQRVWSIIRSLPALGHPQMFLDEYGSALTQPIPGWDVGFLSAIANSGFSSAVRSCWDSCTLATLDGLFFNGGSGVTSEYYLRKAYAAMSGLAVRTSTNDGNVPALGSISTDGQQVRALVGRMAGCGVASWCRSMWRPSGQSPPPPTSVQVRVVLPWTTPHLNINLSYEPFQPGVSSGGPVGATPSDPSLALDGAGREVLTFTIPAFADGSAYDIVISKV